MQPKRAVNALVMTALKKDIELRQLECFKRLISDFPVGELSPQKLPTLLSKAKAVRSALN